jgi:4-carboxymuconolactone decarboxylase
MTEKTDKEPSGAAKMFGDFAPALVHFTDDTLFGQAWTRPELSPRDRSLVTVAALATAGNTEQLTFHLGLARENGVTATELTEAITHLAFYAGWPRPCRPWPWPSRSSAKPQTRSKETQA